MNYHGLKREKKQCFTEEEKTVKDNGTQSEK